MHDIVVGATDDQVRQAAARLEMYERLRENDPADCDFPPDKVLPVDREFSSLYAEMAIEGAAIASQSRVVFCGMARDIADVLPVTIDRIKRTGRQFANWSFVCVENDSTDGTKEILASAAAEDERIVVDMRDLGRPHLRGFEPERVQRYAEYRNRYREIAYERWPDADFVIPIDLDAWGGWSIHGVLNGIGWLSRIDRAACMASTSLYRNSRITNDGKSPWTHYDQWAFRWQGWTTRLETWFVFWLPPPGSYPIQVNSAFGGLAIYKSAPFWQCEYASDNGDIEHVGLHRRMIEAGWSVFLNPSQRCVMMWSPDDGR